MSSLRSFTVTQQTPYEIILPSVIELNSGAANEPAVSQVIYTGAIANYPTCNVNLVSPYYCLCLYAAGRNNTGSTTTISYRVLLNTVSKATASLAVTTNNYWTVSAGIGPFNIGDVAEIRTWASQSGSYLDYYAYQLQLSRFNPNQKYYGYDYFSITTPGFHPALTSGSPGQQGYQWVRHYWTFTVAGTASYYSNGYAMTWNFVRPDPTYQLWRLGLGDFLASAIYGTIQQHASYRPYYVQNYVPLTGTFRGIREPI